MCNCSYQNYLREHPILRPTPLVATSTKNQEGIGNRLEHLAPSLLTSADPVSDASLMVWSQERQEVSAAVEGVSVRRHCRLLLWTTTTTLLLGPALRIHSLVDHDPNSTTR